MRKSRFECPLSTGNSESQNIFALLAPWHTGLVILIRWPRIVPMPRMLLRRTSGMARHPSESPRQSSPESPGVWPRLGLRRLVSTMAAMSSGEGPFGPGLPRLFGENNCRYLRFTNDAWKPRRVEGFSTTAMRSNRPGRMKSVHRPAMTRSIGRRLGARSWPRFRITNWCFTSSDSATTARAPPGRISLAIVVSR